MKPIDPKEFGKRVRERRNELGLSQGALGKMVRLSQSNVGWIEEGRPKRPERGATELAEALQTTREWLLWKEGPKHVGPAYLPTALIAEKYDRLSPEMKAEISEQLEKAEKRKARRTG